MERRAIKRVWLLYTDVEVAIVVRDISAIQYKYGTSDKEAVSYVAVVILNSRIKQEHCASIIRVKAG
jgi:hypothetical protein